MNTDRLIRERRGSWNQLRDAVDRVARHGPKRAGPERVERLIHLYRQAAADLGRLRTAGADAGTLRELNQLVARAHGLIYGKARLRPRRPLSLGEYVTQTYPRLFRRAWRPMLASLLLCAVVYGFAYQTVQQQPLLVASVMGGGVGEFTGEKEPSDIADRFRKCKEAMSSQVMASSIMTNNVYVAVTVFALGITFGVGTIYVLIVNSAMVGGIAGAFAASGIEGALWATLLPHGALELSAIVIAGGTGLMMGWALWCPGRRTRLRAIREEAAAAVQLALGLVPVFVVAGIYEGFVTPSEQIPQELKVTLGVATAGAFWLYLLLAGRRQAGDERNGTEQADGENER